MGIQIAPSILAADFANLEAEAARVPGADWLHVDVMDNHFVPNLTIGLPVVEALAKVARQPIDAHLMITEPDRWAPGYVEAGAQSVTFHVEAAQAPVRLARDLRQRLDDGHADRQVRDEVVVHHVDVQPVGPGHARGFGLEVREVRRQHARRDLDAHATRVSAQRPS